MLYLDPIDLSHSIYRLYQALKPGGQLFLYAYDTHPSWRGLPYSVEINQWMWSWTYCMEEAAQAERVVVMEQGRIVLKGSSAELLKNEYLSETYLGRR
jgi:hypothetical protein